jgi:hypothetical protein
MTLIKQIESNAKKAGEHRLGFLYRRKAAMLQFCLDKVPRRFFIASVTVFVS